jgi:hypothetical protein
MNTFSFVCLLSIVFLIKNFISFNKALNNKKELNVSFNEFNKSFKEHISYNIIEDYNKNYKTYNIYKVFMFHNLLENII